MADTNHGERRLAAIMQTDIVGYTSMTQRSESATMDLLARHNELLRPKFDAFSGSEFKTTGDGFLVLFPNALDAVRCSIDIQKALEASDLRSEAGRPLRIRIGIHAGDVIHREGDIFGDGVNITSRIEPLAEAGGVAISQPVYAQVWNKIDAPILSLGPQKLKNVHVPIDVYRLSPPWDSPAQPVPVGQTLATATPPETPIDRTRLAVLPLANISPDPRDAYLADGMTEELIFTLSKIKGLKVIAKTSVMRYRATDEGIATIGAELGVGTILEGSVRKAGERVRITVQLIDVATQEHLWAEAYDRDLEDLFAIQREIAEQLADELRVQLLPNERTPLDRLPTGNQEAHTLYLRGRHAWNQWTEEGLEAAAERFIEAASVDPEYGLAYAGLADTYSLMAHLGYMLPEEAYPLAEAAAKNALAVDETLAEAHSAIAMIRVIFDGDLSGAEEALRLAIDLDPNCAMAHHWYALVLGATGRAEEAMRETQRALELDPLAPVFNTAIGQLVSSELAS